MDSCKKCHRILYYEPSCGGMCMECWDTWARLEIPWGKEEPITEFEPTVEPMEM